jgi:hypothetical protein
MSWRTAATHGDAGVAELMAHGGPGNAQLGTDLTQGPALAVEVGRTLNVHRDTVTAGATRGDAAAMTVEQRATVSATKTRS